MQTRSQLGRRLIPYGVALLTSGVAFAVTYAAEPLLQRAIFLFFWASLLITAWFGGLGPALAAVALAVLLVKLAFIPPRLSLAVQNAADIAPLLMFAIVGAAIGWLAESVRRSERNATSSNAEFRRIRELLETAEETAQLGSWEWDVASNKVSWSNEMFRVYGVEPGSVAVSFESFLSFVHPDDRDMVVNGVQRAMETHEPFAFDHRVVWPNGTVRWLHGRGNVEVDDAGKPRRMIGSGQDVTQERLLAKQADEARRQAEAANAAKTQFLRSMSHELRTPLNAISGYADLLELGVHGPLNDSQRDAVARMKRSQRHLNTLVEELLSFAKLEAGKVELHLRDVPLNESLMRLGDVIAPQIQAKPVTYEYQGCDPSVAVYCDADRMQQIVINLLANAVKFTEAGMVTLSVRTSASEVAIVVNDTGVGIPGDKLDTIFEPFVQLGHVKDKSASGIGLGLAISRDLARVMAGDVSATSEVGKGSTFTLRLPRFATSGVDGEAAAAAVAADAMLGASPSAQTISPS